MFYSFKNILKLGQCLKHNTLANLLSLALFIFVSCNSEKKEIPKERKLTSYEIQNQLDSINDISANEFARKYNAISGLDIDLGFTYQIEDSIHSSGKPISIIGQISDIVRKDSNMIFTIKGYFSEKKCISEILVTSEQFNDFFKITKPQNDYATYCFIINLNKISSKSLLSIKAEGEDQLDYNFNKQILLASGKLINMYKYKEIEENK